MSPFGMYEALLGRNAEIREERERDIFSILIRDGGKGVREKRPIDSVGNRRDYRKDGMVASILESIGKLMLQHARYFQ